MFKHKKAEQRKGFCHSHAAVRVIVAAAAIYGVWHAVKSFGECGCKLREKLGGLGHCRCRAGETDTVS